MKNIILIVLSILLINSCGLIQLRNAWENSSYCLYRILVVNNNIIVRRDLLGSNNGLSFENQETAKEFVKTFFDLIETAKPLL